MDIHTTDDNNPLRNHNKPSVGRASSELLARLRVDILEGRYGPGRFLPAERQLAVQYGVAQNTVRRALKGLELENLIAVEPRQGYRVLARVNDVAKGCPLAVVVPKDPTEWDAWDRQLVASLQAAVAKQGLSLLTVATHRLTPDEVVRNLLAARAWGTLLHVPNPTLVTALAKVGMPTVVVETMLPGVSVDSVLQDGFGGGMLAASWLAEKHERIAWVGPGLVRTHPQITERYAGALGGLSRFGKTLNPQWQVAVNSEDEPGSRAAVRRLLTQPDRPSAVLALWQSAARQVVQVADELGLVPGRDFDMVGWAREEEYPGEYAPLFKNGPVAPAVVWNMATMMEIALARVEERRARPHLPAIHLRIPTELRFHETSGKEVIR